MRKKLLTIIITISLITTLVGCGNSNTQASNGNNNETTVDTQKKEDNVKNEESAKKSTDNNEKDESSDKKDTNNDNLVKKSNDSNNNKSTDNSNTETNDFKDTSKENHSSTAKSINNKEKPSKSEVINASNEENKNSEIKSNSKNDNLNFQNLAEIIAKKEFKSNDIGNIFPVKAIRNGNNLIFEKDNSSNVFLNTPEEFCKDPKDGLLILILPDAKKDGDKIYHSFKLSSLAMIENGGTGTVDIGRIYNDGTVKFGEF